jgi:hypothetical protein
MTNARTISGDELMQLLDVSEAQLEEITRHSRLPFTVTGPRGMYIRARDLPAWHAAAASISPQLGVRA